MDNGKHFGPSISTGTLDCGAMGTRMPQPPDQSEMAWMFMEMQRLSQQNRMPQQQSNLMPLLVMMFFLNSFIQLLILLAVK